MGKLKGHSLQNSGDSIASIIKIPEKKNPKVIVIAQKISVNILKMLKLLFFSFLVQMKIKEIIGSVKKMMLIIVDKRYNFFRIFFSQYICETDMKLKIRIKAITII